MKNFIKEGLTFDDVLIEPRYSNILPKNVNLKSKLTKNININIPILSSAMDTVTESKMATALAKEGGIGFIHKNMSIENQVKEVCKVKKNSKYVIKNIICVNPYTSLLEAKQAIIKNNSLGCPVIDKNNNLVGIITNRDIRSCNDFKSNIVKSVMTQKNNLITIKEVKEKKFLLNIFKLYCIKQIILIDEKFSFIGLITKKSIEKIDKISSECIDKKGKLRIGAAVGVTNFIERVDELVKAEIDIILIDASHGHSRNVINCIKKIRLKYDSLQIIGGNIATKEAAIDLRKAGVNAVKVGIGCGSICITRIVTGVGVPQISAIFNVAKALNKSDIPIIADGGIRFSGDIAKALSAGASCVMVGSMFAGTKESPGKLIKYKNKLFKSYRGMGSEGAMLKGSYDRYFQEFNKINKFVPEGVEGIVPYKGKLKDIIYQQTGGLRSCMGLIGCKNIKELHKKAKFIKISNASIKENHTYNIIVTKKTTNY
ncbi:MAG: IMP dehydrogenase [Enterobacteriaceae bacterium]